MESVLCLNILANNRKFMERLVEACAKALLRNTEIIETLRLVVQFYESIVSKNILLINPFDQINFEKGENEIVLRIQQIDRVLDEYPDLCLPKIKFVGSDKGSLPINRLFEWS